MCVYIYTPPSRCRCAGGRGAPSGGTRGGDTDTGLEGGHTRGAGGGDRAGRGLVPGLRRPPGAFSAGPGGKVRFCCGKGEPE